MTKKSDIIIGILIGVVVGGVGMNVATCDQDRPSVDSSSPVKKDIQQTITATEKIKLEVEELDSIKNVKVIEAKTLDNDSTLELFYTLIRE